MGVLARSRVRTPAVTRTGLGSRSDHGLFKVEPNAPTWWSPHTGCPLQRLRLPESAVETYTAHSEENTPPPRAVQLNKVYQPQRESHACFTRRFAADKRCSLYVAEHGCKWRGLPKRFGNWHTIYTRIRRWTKAGVLDKMFEELQREQLVRVKIEAVSLDSSSIKVHSDGTGALKNAAHRPSASPAADGTPRFIWLPRMLERP